VAVEPAWYSRDLLISFTGGEYAAFLATGGRRLRPRLARALQLARVTSGMRALDIGCGRGEMALHLARRGVDVTAIDVSSASLTLTAETLALATPDTQRRVRRVRSDAAVLPLPDSFFHRVLCLDVVEHLYPRQLSQTLREIRRVLRPDGYAVFHTLPNRWALEVGYPLLQRLWPRWPRQPRSAYERRVHVNELDLPSLARALDRAGLYCHVWLEGWTTAQARWAADQAAQAIGGRQFPDALRERAYPVLRTRPVTLIGEAVLRTPLRLVFANDIFAIAWRAESPPPASVWPRSLCERSLLWLAGR
jgi:SAM-dependent methyltransferase